MKKLFLLLTIALSLSTTFVNASPGKHKHQTAQPTVTVVDTPKTVAVAAPVVAQDTTKKTVVADTAKAKTQPPVTTEDHGDTTMAWIVALLVLGTVLYFIFRKKILDQDDEEGTQGEALSEVSATQGSTGPTGPSGPKG